MSKWVYCLTCSWYWTLPVVWCHLPISCCVLIYVRIRILVNMEDHHQHGYWWYIWRCKHQHLLLFDPFLMTCSGNLKCLSLALSFWISPWSLSKWYTSGFWLNFVLLPSRGQMLIVPPPPPTTKIRCCFYRPKRVKLFNS